jgi:hypothetical protein
MRKGGWQKDLHFSYKICAILLTVTVKKMSGFAVTITAAMLMSLTALVFTTATWRSNVWSWDL